jgi:hypothetical protein
VVAGESSEAGNPGFARDDKKGRVVAGTGRLLDETMVVEPTHF